MPPASGTERAIPTGEPLDQRVDDAFSLCFDTEPLSERFELLGAPALELHLDCDRPVALVAVRLNDVAPDGSSLRVSYGVLNLTHREGHEAPTPLVPDERFTARIKLDHIAHAFAPGHRIRIAISTAYWPLAWPSPEVVTLGVHCGRSTLILPRLECGTESPALHPFEAPRRARAMNREVHRLGRSTRTVVEDVASGEVRVIEIRDLGDYCISDIGLRFRERPLRHCPIAMTAAIALKGNAGSSESLVELPEIPIRSRPPRLGAAARSVRGTARPPNAPAAPSAALRARKARRVVAPIPEVAGSATRSRGIDPELEASFFVFIALSPLGARGPRTPDYAALQLPARALIRRDATGRRHRGDGIRFRSWQHGSGNGPDSRAGADVTPHPVLVWSRETTSVNEREVAAHGAAGPALGGIGRRLAVALFHAGQRMWQEIEHDTLQSHSAFRLPKPGPAAILSGVRYT